MSLLKIVFPQFTSAILLFSAWASGADPVFIPEPDHQTNLRKYVQVQQRILDNYFGETDLNELYQLGLKGFVEGLSDSTITLPGTPLDTLVAKSRPVSTLRESYMGFEQAYLFVANTYPEEDVTRLTEDAIRSMMSTLDPHSVYIEPEDNERIQEEFAGKFQGIGIQFNIINDTITVVTAISGGPSDLLGIRSGDRIIQIEDSTAVGFTNEDVVKRLRGEKGTEVDVTIMRPGVSSLLEFTIIRDDIPLFTLDSHYMLDERTGYVKINRFAATTHEEFITAVEDLKARGMDRIVVDLRNNPGGYMSQAIEIAEEFFPRGTVLVGTKSRHNRFNSEYSSRGDGALKDMHVIMLVNEGSASASEIVSGAIQDHDRGLIVGSRTFGKGLVQQQYELVDRSNIRVTISHYYTPSGRLIQKPFVEGREEYAYEIAAREHNARKDAMEFIEHVPDSLRFSTAAGRAVYGGGGIVPDVVVEEDTTLSGYLFNFMLAKRVDFDFVRRYLDENGDAFRARWEADFDAFRADFSWSQDDLDAFMAMMKERGLTIDDAVTEPVVSGDSLTVSSTYIEQIDWMNRGRMKAELARQVWGTSYFYPVINDIFGEPIKQAMTLWDAVDRLEKLAKAEG